ncbi:YggS family pyridoxal phosphate-dependent enzyme [Amnibacterium kyonggiense]
MTELADRLHGVQERIAAAARAADRDPAEVALVVVTKFQPVELLQELYELGVRDFGESRHPEARDKAAALPDDVVWHFIGQLQTNKARQVAKYADVVHSVDRIELIEALDGRELDVLLQVDLGISEGGSEGPSRGGARPGAIPSLAARVLESEGLRLRGVMTVAPLGMPVVPAFSALRMVSERVRGIDPAATWMSAGMSGDFRAAIAAGATHVRIGSAVTGPRSTGL